MCYKCHTRPPPPLLLLELGNKFAFIAGLPAEAFRREAKAGEEGEDDARSACPFDTLGYTHNRMATTTRSDEATLS